MQRLAPRTLVDIYGCVAPAAELLYEQAAPRIRGYWDRLDSHLALTAPIPGAGDWDSAYLRFVNPREVEGTLKRAGFPAGPFGSPDTDGGQALESGVLQDNPLGRLTALKGYGIDSQLLSPVQALDGVLELDLFPAIGILEAYNRYIEEYCALDDVRLRGTLQVHGRDPQWSATAIYAAGSAISAATIYLPAKVAPDQANFAVVWRALHERDMGLVHRPQTGARVWTPAYLVRYLTQTEVFDRWPKLRIAFVGWPYGEMKRLAEVAESSDANDGDNGLLRRLYVAANAATLPKGADDLGCLRRRLAWASEFPVSPTSYASMLNALPEDDETRDALIETLPNEFLRGNVERNTHSRGLSRIAGRRWPSFR